MLGDTLHLACDQRKSTCPVVRQLSKDSTSEGGTVATAAQNKGSHETRKMTPGDIEANDIVSPGEERDLQSLTTFLQSVSTSSSVSPKNSRSPSPSFSLPTLSPHFKRKRLLNITKTSLRNVEGILGSSPPARSVLRLAKDPIQPSSGSITDVHSEASIDEDDEELDFFNLESSARPRASTCPENRAWQRRARIRSLRRPPTPPPGSTENLQVEKQFSKLMVKDKLKIHSRELQEVPETGLMIGEMSLNGTENT